MNKKAMILELLETHRGEAISGESIAVMLQVSRNAVWKAVKELREEGYRILAVTNKGYCLSAENDILSAQGIKPFLSPGSLIFADRLHVYSTLESTNQTAKELAIAGSAHGTVVISDCQTAGRGRYDRSFFSPSGGLYMSVILRPDALHFETPTAVTAYAAVSVCEALETVCGKQPMIKWVNDLFLDGKKVCGILTEAVTDFESGRFQWIVVGIGININLRTGDLPEDLRAIAASVDPENEIPGIRNRLAAEIINRMLGRQAPLSEAELFRSYKTRLMLLGEQITVVQGSSSYPATAIDVDAAGHLIVKREDGELVSLSSGEISVRI